MGLKQILKIQKGGVGGPMPACPAPLSPVGHQEADDIRRIVFAGVIDPVGAGLVASLSRPGGNTTGFAGFEYGLSAKWLELLKQIAPRVTRGAVLRDSLTTVGIGQLAAKIGRASCRDRVCV